jgi:hypothetical protein
VRGVDVTLLLHKQTTELCARKRSLFARETSLEIGEAFH